MATNYFEQYPKILYSLDDLKTGQIVTDIFRRNVISKELIENSSAYDLYDIQDGESPEFLADKFYGDPTLHWVILTVNEITDPRFEWPLAYVDLLAFIKAKYGGELSPWEAHNVVNKDEQTVNQNFLVFEDSTPENPRRIVVEDPELDETVRTPFFHSPDPQYYRTVTNYEYENELNEKKRRIRILNPSIVGELISKFNESVET